MNRLQLASSPYLRQHANNPVDWYPWGDEALRRARAEDKPILVSIGYSTCHWCHVMARESFEDPEVAEYMNALFVCVKVDREERPDLDALYMDACQVIAGTAGWPLHVFLTPDLKPFHAGTYFPPEPRGELPSWMETLNFVAYNFYENRAAVEAEAEKVMARLRRDDKGFISSLRKLPKRLLDKSLYHKVLESLRKSYDDVYGGFSRAPKFPNLMILDFLQKAQHYFGFDEAGRMVAHSLRHMLNGGIYDQIGGGIARYATTVDWLVPHFEKMLYDNALLIRLLARQYQITREPWVAEKLVQTIEWLEREMSHPDGAFYAALDAESEGEEGKYYTWTKADFDKAAGKDARSAAKYWGVTATGNWDEMPGRNILHVTSPDDAFRTKAGTVAKRLLRTRLKRVQPHKDKKILLNWNALTVSALVAARQATGNEHYGEMALKALRFLLKHFVNKDGRLYHVWTDGNATTDGVLSDYALLIDALLNAYELDFNRRFLTKAEDLLAVVLKDFSDDRTGLFFGTSSRQTDIVLRRHDIYDGEIPSGNAMMVYNLLRLALWTDTPAFRTRAEKMVAHAKKSLLSEPASFGAWWAACTALYPGILEIAVVGANAREKAQRILTRYIPDRIIAAAARASARNPLLAHKKAARDALIYVCKNYTCDRPVTDPDVCC